MALQPDPAWQLLDVCDWASNERIVCSLFLFQTRKAPTLPYARLFSRVRLVAVDADGGNRVPLLDSLPPSPTKFAGVLSAPWTPNDDNEHAVVDYLVDEPGHVLVSAARQAKSYTSVYRVDIQRGTAERIVDWLPGIAFWRADHQGRVRVGTGWYQYGANIPPIAGVRIVEPYLGPTAVARRGNGTLERVDVAQLSARFGPAQRGAVRVHGFSADGARIYLEANADGRVWEAQAATLKPLRVVVESAGPGIRAEAIGASGCGVAGFMHPVPQRPFTWLNAAIGEAVAAAARKLPGNVVAVTSMSTDCQSLVLATDGSQRAFHVLERRTGKLLNLGGERANADGAPVTRREALYDSGDGARQRIALTLPAAPKEAPIVILLDDGWGRSSAAPLDTWPRRLAALGYVVAAPTVRNPYGYATPAGVAGEDPAQGLREDVSATLSWLRRQALGDPRRVCFAGRGRGGYYALLAALAATDVAQRCVAAYAATTADWTKRAHHQRRFDSGVRPCCDWQRWATPWTWTTRNSWARSSKKISQELFGATPSPPSVLVGAVHPGFPIHIQTTGEGQVHETNSRRFRAALRQLAELEHVAARGSAAEAAFLARSESLFHRVLGGRAAPGP